MAAVAVPRLTGFQDSAKKKADISNARIVAGAAQIAYTDYVAVANGSTLSTTLLTGYLNEWPTIKLDTPYTLTLSVSSGTFTINAVLANGTTYQLYPKPATITGNPWYN